MIDASIVILESVVLIAMTFVIVQSFCAWACLRRRRRYEAQAARGEDIVTGTHSESSADTPPVSILKPMTGLEDGLRANLESFLRLDYPDFEIIFCLQDPEDPALPLLHELLAEHPERPCSIVVSRYHGALNPKVSNLLPGYEAARHDLVLVSDANVRVREGYLREAVSHFADPSVGLVHHLVRGTEGVTLGAVMDNGYLNTFLAGAVALFQRLGISCVVGKSMLFRKRDLDPLGGLQAAKDYLAEDYILAARLELAGLRTVVSPVLVDRVASHTSIGGFVRRYARWGTIRRSISGPAYLLETLVNPTPAALGLAITGALAHGVFDPAVILAVAAVVVKSAVDAVTLVALDLPARLRDVLTGPLRDLLIFYAWAAGGLRRTVSWRGITLSVAKGSKLRPLGNPRVQEDFTGDDGLTGPQSLPGLRRVARGRHPAPR